MVKGVNELGESSSYLYDGLGALVQNTWVIKKNAYGYHDVSALATMVDGEIVVDQQTGKKDKKDKLDPEVVAASPTLNKTSTVVKRFVVDYTSETFEPLMEYEVNGLDYRYVYGNDRLSVNVKGITNGAGKLIENGDQVRLYYHMDLRGTVDYLTSPMSGKVESWTHYNEWGEITHNAVLKCGQRELDMVKRYATHDYDQVLGLYYAKARFYDAANRRCTAIDPILDGSRYDLREYVKNPVELVQYLYVVNNPLIHIDPLGMFLQGTRLSRGAQGEDALFVNWYLYAEGYLSKKDYLANQYCFTAATEAAVIKFQTELFTHNGVLDSRGVTGVITSTEWKNMGLKHSGYKINTTLEEEFWSGTKGNDVIKVSISGTDITIDYFPKIYVCERHLQKGSYVDYGTEYEYDMYVYPTASDAVYKSYEKRAVEGFKQWAKDSVNIQGVNAKVIVNVTPTRARSRGDANVTITTYKTGTSMVPTTLYWSTSTKPSMILSDARESGDASYVDRVTGKPRDMFSNMAAHEFGHVLGLWDAYGYGDHWRPLEYPLPAAPANRAGTLNVMRSPWWSEFGYEAINYGMMLYAWSTNSLGGWTETVLTNTSQAFYR